MDIDIELSVNRTSYNKPIYGFFGTYTLTEGVVMPYLSATLDLERTIKELRTYDQIPPNLDMVWSLQELYQREIDYDRIEKELVNGYLKDPHKIKFFNAVTIMLFPRESGGAIGNQFPAAITSDPKVPVDEDNGFDRNFSKAEAQRAVFGGVQFIRYGEFGRLRWDENSVLAVAVDGQHRVCALRKWYETLNNTLTDEQKNTKIPLIFLIAHPRAGFRAGTQFNSIRQVAREIFTDLNKNAKKVDEAREIILDDKSLDALAARTLVTADTSRDSAGLLPLSLVRWQDANARFDQSFFLNSLVHLHQVVQIALDLRPPKNPMDTDGCEKFITSLGQAVGTGSPPQVMHEGVSLLTYYRQNFVADEEAFRPLLHLPESYLAAAVDGFEREHKPYLLRFLVHFRPYQQLLEYAREQNLIEGFFSQWFAQPKEHQRQLRGMLEREDGHWEKNKITVHIDKIQEIKGRGPADHWGFKNIFQKACVKVLRLVCFNHREDRLGDAVTVVQFLDTLFERGLLAVQREIPGPYKLWTFIALHAGGNSKIKVSARTENNLYQLLLLAYYANRKFVVDSASKRTPITDVKVLLRYFRSGRSHDEVPSTLWPGCVDACNHLEKMFGEQAEPLLGTSLENLSKEDKEKAKERVGRQRLQAVIAELCVTFPPEVGEN
jgi:hypothetical protein